MNTYKLLKYKCFDHNTRMLDSTTDVSTLLEHVVRGMVSARSTSAIDSAGTLRPARAQPPARTHPRQSSVPMKESKNGFAIRSCRAKLPERTCLGPASEGRESKVELSTNAKHVSLRGRKQRRVGHCVNVVEDHFGVWIPVPVYPRRIVHECSTLDCGIVQIEI